MGRRWGAVTAVGLAATGALALIGAGSAAAVAPSVDDGPQAELTCNGLPVTVDQHRGSVTGTPRADVIVLTAPGRVDAGPGDDVICGSPGRDVISGGPGDDVVYGDGGDDTLRGGAGEDQLHGDLGDDRLLGGADDDRLIPGPGDDVPLPGAGDNLVMQGEGASFSIYMSPSDAAALRAAGKQVALATGQPGATGVIATLVTPVEAQMNFAFGTEVSGFVNGPEWNVSSPLAWVPMTPGRNLTWQAGNRVASRNSAGWSGYEMTNESGQDGVMGIGLFLQTGGSYGPAVVDYRVVPDESTWRGPAIPDRITIFLTDGPGRVVTIPTREMRTIPLKPGDTLRFIYEEGELLRVP